MGTKKKSKTSELAGKEQRMKQIHKIIVSIVYPHLKYNVQFLSFYFKKVKVALEKAQTLSMKMMKGVKCLLHKE